MDNTILQALIQGGLASVALVSLGILYRIISNHLSHLTDAINRLENTLLELQQFLKDKL